MLNSKNLDNQSYEERLRDAIAQIALYSDEWTNYNPSEPGITVLENLTAFTSLQQSAMNEVTSQVRQNLLRLAGFVPGKSKSARLLLGIGAKKTEKTTVLQANKQFWLGDLCFETNRVTTVYPYRITGIFSKRGDDFFDHSYLCGREFPMPGYIFGESPKVGDSIYFAMDGITNPNEPLLLYVTVADRWNRNPFPKGERNLFASLKWEYYTQGGFVELQVRDFTNCFLTSGEIHMRFSKEKPSPCPEFSGKPYVVRATLTRADYDICPKLMGVTGFLFEVWQKQTLSVCCTFQNVRQAYFSSDMAREGYFLVFCKEEKGSSYYRYESAYDSGTKGRYYELKRGENGEVYVCFDQKGHGCAPGKFRDAVRVLIYTEELMRRYMLGCVLGYDNQEIKLPVTNIVYDTFSILAKRVNEEGEEVYDFVRPERYEPEALTYHLLCNSGTIVIEDAGDYIGAELFVASCSISRGSEGNIRAGGSFSQEGEMFYNPGPGTGGCFQENDRQLQQRFCMDVQKSYTAVTAADYEMLVRNTPQLCIHKVHAVMDEKKNLVKIAVKPGTDARFPTLSEIYCKEIHKYLEKHRLLTTRIQIVSTSYVRINVQGTIYVRQHHENCREQIEEALCTVIDYQSNGKNPGDILRFNEVFHALENVTCVDLIYELSLRPQLPHQARMQDADIIPEFNCLCCPGIMSLRISTCEQ